jgi:anti-sigma B factor antagonist
VTVLRIDVHRNGATGTISLFGELDLSGEAEMEAAFAEAESNGAGVMVIDLRGLSFIDSTGLRGIVSADIRARKDGRRLVLIPGPEHVHRVFRIALLDRRLEFVDDPSEIGDDGEPG